MREIQLLSIKMILFQFLSSLFASNKSSTHTFLNRNQAPFGRVYLIGVVVVGSQIRGGTQRI